MQPFLYIHDMYNKIFTFLCDLWLSQEFPKIKVLLLSMKFTDFYMKNVSIDKKYGKGRLS